MLSVSALVQSSNGVIFFNPELNMLSALCPELRMSSFLGPIECLYLLVKNRTDF